MARIQDAVQELDEAMETELEVNLDASFRASLGTASRALGVATRQLASLTQASGESSRRGAQQAAAARGGLLAELAERAALVGAALREAGAAALRAERELSGAWVAVAEGEREGAPAKQGASAASSASEAVDRAAGVELESVIVEDGASELASGVSEGLRLRGDAGGLPPPPPPPPLPPGGRGALQPSAESTGVTGLSDGDASAPASLAQEQARLVARWSADVGVLREMERTMAEISEMMSTVTVRLAEQHAQVDRVHEHAQESVATMVDANDQLGQAASASSGYRTYMLVFLVAAGLIVLSFDFLV